MCPVQEQVGALWLGGSWCSGVQQKPRKRALLPATCTNSTVVYLGSAAYLQEVWDGSVPTEHIPSSPTCCPKITR